jgi:mono/diheme cytochrome c family protein
MRLINKIIFIFLICCHVAVAAEPTLTIKSGTQTVTYTRSQLLQRTDLQTITTLEDPAYRNQKMTYQAVPVTSLFKAIVIPANATIQFQTLDEFSAPIAKDKLLANSPEQASAYIAIESADKKWPAIKPGVDDRTPGPFYLIWKNPKKSNISTEEWPFQLAGFSIEDAFAVRFPHVAPNADMAETSAVMRGFKVFKSNCFTCHTVNREGQGKIGPDLNVPHNPTEYLSTAHLKIFIRNPQNLRYFPQDKMGGFPVGTISDQELDDVLAYLAYMAKHKVASTPPNVKY